MIFIGQTRFSVFNPRSTSFLASDGSVFSGREEYQAYLYSEKRLDMRTELFVNQSLPQLEMAIGAHDVPHIVTYSDSLPEKYQRILEEAAERYPFVILDRRSPGRAAVLPEHVARYLILEQDGQDPGQAFGVYNLDDDDILPVGYFDQNVRHIKPENAGRQVSHPTGITAIYTDGAYNNAKRCHSPMFSAGLMNICRFARDGTLIAPRSIPHDAVGQGKNVILESQEVGYFRVRHTGQDTSLGFQAFNQEMLLEKLLEDIAPHPAATRDEIKAGFPTIASRVFLDAKPDQIPQALMASPRLLAMTKIPLPLPKPLNRLAVAVDLTCGFGVIPRNVLVSLDLVDSSNTPVDPESLKDSMGAARLALSGNPSIGFFRYLRSEPGRQISTYAFELPAGVYCRGLSFRLWRRYETAVTLHNATIASPDAWNSADPSKQAEIA